MSGLSSCYRKMTNKFKKWLLFSHIGRSGGPPIRARRTEPIRGGVCAGRPERLASKPNPDSMLRQIVHIKCAVLEF
jgi:hypothetical protein